MTHMTDGDTRGAAIEKLARRRFLGKAGAFGIGGALAAGGMLPVGTALAQSASDADVLNFALNLEYLEAEFYIRAATGEGLPFNLVKGVGRVGRVRGGRAVNFQTPIIRQYAREIAADERAHVAFLRQALGSAAVSRPDIDLTDSFTGAARAAGLVGPDETFDAFANENNFLLAAYIFEDVGVTAYKGAAPLITNATFLEAAAGILAAEAYHAGNIRTVLYGRGIETPSLGLIEASLAISDARDSLDGASDVDQGVAAVDGNGEVIVDGTVPVGNIVPTDANGICYSRSAGQVLNVVYLTPASATGGGFFPNGVNGLINTSDGNA